LLMEKLKIFGEISSPILRNFKIPQFRSHVSA
jgi:hypothetical protein